VITPFGTTFGFRASISDSGYEWLKGTDGKPRLVPRRVPGVGFRSAEAPPGLFRGFANTPRTKDAIQRFAGLHGDLFNRYDPNQGVALKDGTWIPGASFGTWSQEIEDMRVLVALWDDVQNRRIESLSKVIKWTDKQVSYVVKTPRRESHVTLAHTHLPGTNLGPFSKKDVVLPARYAVQREINVRLSDYAAVPQLVWTSDKPGEHQRIIFRLPDLLSAMWLQFAQAATGEFQLRVCAAPGCGKYFQVGPGGRRADATTCNDACRQSKKRNSEN
jgi:hypothetical protein